MRELLETFVRNALKIQALPQAAWNQSFVDLGGDPMAALTLSGLCRTQWGVTVDAGVWLDPVTSLAQLAERLDAAVLRHDKHLRVAAKENPWLALRQPRSQAAVRLVCLPPIGGSGTFFHGWRAKLGEHVDVCPVELPGHWGRPHEALETRVEALVAQAGSALLPLFDRPVVFYGDSMGAFLAFELARWLRRQAALQPVGLIVRSSCAPHIQRRAKPPLHQLPDGPFLQIMAALAGAKSPQALGSADFVAAMLPVLRADMALAELYAHREEAPLSCPITVLGGDRDPVVPIADLRAWDRHTTGETTSHIFAGAHDFIREHTDGVLRVVGNVCKPA